MKVKRLWIGFTVVMVVSFSVLLFFGRQIYHEKPPIPGEVVTNGNRVLFTEADILDGQNVWQSIGGQEVGTIWGHGSYVAPDWSADWLHREALFMLDYLSDTSFHKPFKDVSKEDQAMLKVRLQAEIRSTHMIPLQIGFLYPHSERMRSNLFLATMLPSL